MIVPIIFLAAAMIVLMTILEKAAYSINLILLVYSLNSSGCSIRCFGELRMWLC